MSKPTRRCSRAWAWCRCRCRRRKAPRAPCISMCSPATATSAGPAPPDMARIRISDRILAARAERQATATLRPRRVIEARDGAKVAVDGQVLVNFCGNDYLGLSQHLDVVTALQAAAAYHGVGATGSALV